MVRRPAFSVSYADDDSWRRELCPDCGMRLFGLANWRDHGPRHRWGSEWLAARLRAAFPGENVRVDPAVLVGGPVIEIHAVEDSAWKAGIEA
jgi:hypothetical protein